MSEFADEIYFAGGANSDDDSRVVPKGDWREAHYFSLGDPYGYGSSLVNSRGTRIVPNGSIDSTMVINGVCDWVEQNSIIYFVYVSISVSQIWVYNIDSETHSLALSNGDLNFSPSWPIYHANMVGDICKWTDGRWDDQMYDSNGNRLFNPPYQLNIQKALDGEYTTVTLQTIDAIKWPPKEPTVEYATDTTHFGNALGADLYKFRVQWIYENNEPSVYSHFSDLVTPINSQYISGNNVTNDNADNRLNVTVQTGPEVVKKINVAYSKNDGPWILFEQIDKAQAGLSNNTETQIAFFGNVAGRPVDSDNYDRLPINTYCQELSPNKEIIYSNYREGYDKPEIDIEVETVITAIEWSPVIPELEAEFLSGTPDRFNFSWADNSNFTVTEGQTFTTPVTVDSSSGPPTTFILTYTVSANNIINALLLPTPEEQMGYILEQIINAYVSIMNEFALDTYTSVDVSDNLVYIKRADDGPFVGTINSVIRPVVLSLAQPTMKLGMTHEFGIEYYDRAERTCTVCTIDEMSIYVPFPSEESQLQANDQRPYLVWPRFTINNQPPIWADYFRFVYKSKGEISRFLQCTIADIIPDQNRIRFTLDFFYPDNNRGATYEMTPSRGDVARFLRKQPTESSDPDIPYLDEGQYFELPVLEYSPDQGIGGNPCIWVPVFAYDVLFQDGDLNTDAGQLLEIYTPRPTEDPDGNVTQSEWRVISNRFDVVDAHTPDRNHGGTTIEGGCGPMTQGSNQFYIFSQTGTFIDYSGLVGYPITVVNGFGIVDMGVILTAVYNAVNGRTTITTTNTWNLPDELNPGNFSAQYQQDFAQGIPAIVDLEWGNVWLRQREMTSSYPAPLDSFFYFIESFEFTDYQPSDVHQYGEFDIEDPYARMVHKMASAIHSGTFIDGSQINGTSTFRLNLENTVEMRDQFGPINRIIMDGKTLKCIQTKKENSVYLQGTLAVAGDGEFAPQGVNSRTFTQSGVRPYQSLYGTQDPNSVVLLPDSSIAYWDRTSGSFILSPNNGQINISKRAKYVKKSQEIKNLYSTYDDVVCRSYVNEFLSEIGWCFTYNGNTASTIVTYNYVRHRFVSTFDYNFRFFSNIGEYLIGFGADNQLYVHNQNTFTFHGEDFESIITAVSNEGPGLIKRGQDVGVKGTSPLSFTITADPNDTYPQQRTYVYLNMMKQYEGHFWGRFRRNVLSNNYYNEEYNLANGNEMRASAFTLEGSYATSYLGENIVVFSLKVTGVLSETIQ